jgi:hypothetical protein
MANPIIEALASRVSDLELAVAAVEKKQAEQEKIRTELELAVAAVAKKQTELDKMQADLNVDLTALSGLLARTEKLVSALKALG